MTNFQIESREWWVERWLDLLNSYRFKKRLERGRNYAREGNVLSIDFTEAQVLASVQGSEVEPYQVSLSLEPFTEENWNYVIDTMSQKAIFSAQLLAGEMPANIEQVFTNNGLSLFPFSLSDIRSRCSCPDKANPCKHIAAVYYQLSDRFSEDPFVLFQLRGRTKTQILETLRQIRSQKSTSINQEEVQSVYTSNRKNASSKTQTKNTKLQQDSTIADYKNFWKYDAVLESSLVVIAPSTESKSILDLLGKIPLSAADADAFEQYLNQTYQTASQQAIISALQRDE
jgi:uncharacterized Zn finger protein